MRRAEEHIDTIRELYAAGLSIRDLSKELGLDRRLILLEMQYAGIPRRPARRTRGGHMIDRIPPPHRQYFRKLMGEFGYARAKEVLGDLIPPAQLSRNGMLVKALCAGVELRKAKALIMGLRNPDLGLITDSDAELLIAEMGLKDA